MPAGNRVSRGEINQAADKAGLSRSIFYNLISAESGGRVNAVSPAGARGPGQLMPATAKSLGVNIDNPVDNLRGAADYLSEQLKKFGNYRLALAAYNAGPGAVEKYGDVPPYPETEAYVTRILDGAGTAIKTTPITRKPTRLGKAAVAPVSAPQGIPGLSDGLLANLAAGATKSPREQLADLTSSVLTAAPAPSAQSPIGEPPPPRAQKTGPPRVTGATAGDPVPRADLSSIGGEHPTEGLPGYPARDYFAKAGSPLVAPATGKVVKLSGHNPAQGPTEGPHGPFGWSVYIQAADGKTYYLTHLGARDVKLGETVKAGQPIGAVGDYARYGTPSHVHMGVNG